MYIISTSLPGFLSLKFFVDDKLRDLQFYRAFAAPLDPHFLFSPRHWYMFRGLLGWGTMPCQSRGVTTSTVHLKQITKTCDIMWYRVIRSLVTRLAVRQFCFTRTSLLEKTSWIKQKNDSWDCNAGGINAFKTGLTHRSTWKTHLSERISS